MKKILYATDFSKNAKMAFNFALRIAEKHHAELIMLHVFDIPPIWTNTYEIVVPVKTPATRNGTERPRAPLLQLIIGFG